MLKQFILLAIILFSIKIFSQTTVVLQPGPTEGKDARLFDLDGNQNAGDIIDFIATGWTFQSVPGRVRSVIQFDLSGIPAGAVIIDARLSLFHNDVSTAAGQAGQNAAFLRRITEDWQESTVNWNNQPVYTTENQIYIPTSVTETQDYENIDVSPLIRDILQDPSNSFGFMFMLEDEFPYNSMKFFSSDAAQPSQRPRLEITYFFESIDCVSFQPGTEGKDARALSAFPSTNYGDLPEFISAAWTFQGADGISRSFIDFDFSLPANAEVINADLSLYHVTNSGSVGHEGLNQSVIRRVIDPWQENTVNWNNQPGTTDIHQVFLQASVSTEQDYPNINVTDLIKDIVADPSSSYGLSIGLVTEEIYRSLKFASGDWAEESQRPTLEICYRINTATHDPDLKPLHVYPNPFVNSLSIVVEGKNTVIITNIQGKIVYTKHFNSSGHISLQSLENLPPGVYVVKTIGENGHYLNKVVKQ